MRNSFQFIGGLLGLLIAFCAHAHAQVADVDLSKANVPGRPFYYSVAVPDGNYRVSVTLGARKKSTETTIRAESRRLFYESVKTRKGELKTVSFIVNKRSPYISENQQIKIKPREKDFINWDDSLTLEFCGAFPAVSHLKIERDTTVATLYLCGNSTVVDQEMEPWASWGQMVPRWFDDGIAVANYAESGLTANTFLAQGRFDKILTTLRPGDYVLCEFGHNDQKEKSPGAGAYYNFAYALKRFIDGARSKGATILFATPTQRRAFDEAGLHIKETHADYPDAMREVARRENVPVVELHDLTRTFFETLGFEASKKALVHYPANTFPGQDKALADNTHFNPYGAYEVAKMVIQSLISLQLPIASHVRNDFTPFDPSVPDNPDTFVWYPAQRFETKKPDGN